MDGFDVLSVDTAYDERSAAFAVSRKEMYLALQGSNRIVTLSYDDANRSNMMRMLKRANSSNRHCHSLVISSHGKPGQVLDDSDSPRGILFSVDDSNEELALIGKDRSVYICACETGDSDLPELLVENGALLVVSYRQKPSWKSAETAMMWKDFDKEIVKALIYRQGADSVKSHRDQYIKMIDDNLEYYDDYSRKDLERMMEVINTINILEGI